MIQIYTIEIFKKFDIQVKWSTIYWGIKNNLLDLKSVSDYAVNFINNYPDIDIPELLELAWDNDDKSKTIELLETIAKKQPDIFRLLDPLDIKKWRYCIVKSLRESELSNSEILDKVELIYSDFGYPVELAGAVRYMSPKDGYNPNDHTKEENEQHMICEIDKFLEVERESLS
ncbi:DUF2247 family protein [Wukongibacter sp. M2B1]|uniref:DUF2247 family protein n=1 Tax=Wukongibacter sp. M2B1 TaxID=3088895 RepID=UPI003D78FD2F